MKNIALFGGTFDPIHNAHLALCAKIQASFHFQELLFLPAHIPAHKKSPHRVLDRVAMLKEALKSHPIENTSICLTEINRLTKSYTVDTLEEFRQQTPNLALTFILGFDMFLNLDTWHRPYDLLNLCNLLVLKRATVSNDLPPFSQKLLENNLTKDKLKLKTASSSNIYIFDAGQYAISSSMIRTRVKNKLSIQKFVPESVALYIKKHNLYCDKPIK
ncbi:MAG: nicotinate (nicotinamide) nucleotide adenylyltransferase [Legionellales bacterium RIFCSPHIGHO2_12_FULL_37_14]|nr:MAG: nicotinate (nicotinamide) nucleotide adenylyltransferase [Legionellales bacterium RIFCSPHIGHO2_12_FULL_37_14]